MHRWWEHWSEEKPHPPGVPDTSTLAPPTSAKVTWSSFLNSGCQLCGAKAEAGWWNDVELACSYPTGVLFCLARWAGVVVRCCAKILSTWASSQLTGWGEVLLWHAAWAVPCSYSRSGKPRCADEPWCLDMLWLFLCSVQCVAKYLFKYSRQMWAQCLHPCNSEGGNCMCASPDLITLLGHTSDFSTISYQQQESALPSV